MNGKSESCNYFNIHMYFLLEDSETNEIKIIFKYLEKKWNYKENIKVLIWYNKYDSMILMATTISSP